MSKTVGKVLIGLGVPAAGLGIYILNYARNKAWYDDEAAIQGSLIGGLGAVLLAIGLAKVVKPIVGVVPVVLFGAFAAWVVLGGQAAQREREAGYAAQRALGDALWPVCEGTPIAGAATYAPGGRSPTMVFMKQTDGSHYTWGADEPGTWAPKTIAEAQLVACVVSEVEARSGCSYTVPGDIDRFVGRGRYVDRVTVYEAKTGVKVATGDVFGSEPDECPAEMTFTKGSFGNDRNGGLPLQADVLALIRKHVE